MIDYSLYLVTDRNLCCGRTLIDVVRAAIDGGVSCVQVREKDCTTREFIDLAYGLKKLLDDASIPLIVNDRVDVALAVSADGVHLGQTDMAIADARKIMGTKSIIGISAESLDDAITAEKEGADYIGVSPVFATETKKDTSPPLLLSGLRQIRRKVSIPIVGIGGINIDNAAEVIEAGADGIAVVSAIVAAPSAELAAQQLLLRVNEARRKDNVR